MPAAHLPGRTSDMNISVTTTKPDSLLFLANALSALPPCFTFMLYDIKSRYVISVTILAFCILWRMQGCMLALKHGLKMVWVNTRLVVAFMVNVVTGWDWSFERLVGKDVRPHEVIVAFPKLSIAGNGKRRTPFPATCNLVNLVFLCKSFNSWPVNRHN